MIKNYGDLHCDLCGHRVLDPFRGWGLHETPDGETLVICDPCERVTETQNEKRI